MNKEKKINDILFMLKNMDNYSLKDICDRIQKVVDTFSTETPKDKLILFSVSFLPTKENKEQAFKYAEMNGSVMMDHTELGQALEMLHLFEYFTKEKAYFFWDQAAEKLLSNSSGNVTAFVNNADYRSTFARIELVQLIKNNNVLTINGKDKKSWIKEYIEKNPGCISDHNREIIQEYLYQRTPGL